MTERDTSSEWLTLAEAARVAGVGRSTMHEVARRGEVQFTVLASHGRPFRRADVESFRESAAGQMQLARVARRKGELERGRRAAA